MNADMEFVNYVYEVSIMGCESLETLLRKIKDKDNKIKADVEYILKGHEHFKKEAKSILKKNREQIKEPSMIAKMGSWMGITGETLKDNSDARLADMIIRGLTMGLLDLEKYLGNFDKNTKDDTKKLAASLKDFESESIKLLKKYL